MTSRTDNPVGAAVVAAAYRARGLNPDSADEDPDFMRNALTWDFQLRRALAALEQVDPTRRMQLTFEECCSDLAASTSKVARFVGVTQSGGPTSVPTVDPERTRPPTVPSRDDVRRIWGICGETAQRLGYSEP